WRRCGHGRPGGARRGGDSEPPPTVVAGERRGASSDAWPSCEPPLAISRWPLKRLSQAKLYPNAGEAGGRPLNVHKKYHGPSDFVGNPTDAPQVQNLLSIHQLN